MSLAEFEEKQYEVPANIELGLQHAGVFAAGQVLEAIVGYDVAVSPPQDAPIWQLIGVNAPPGLLLIPNLWQRARAKPKAADLPSLYVSLIFQYKRPHTLSSIRSRQWHYWKKHHYRFSILRHQQLILERLEAALSNRAVLRYSCPAFSTYHELQSRQKTHTVLQHSAFVLPSALIGHEAWTYDSPGSVGYANAGGVKGRTETVGVLWDCVKAVSRGRKENLFEHLRGMASEVQAREITNANSPPWLSDFALKNKLNKAQRQAVFDVIYLCELVGGAGASWFVADLEIANP